MRHILVGVCQVKFPYVILYYIMLKGSVHFRSFYILLINYDFFCIVWQITGIFFSLIGYGYIGE